MRRLAGWIVALAAGAITLGGQSVIVTSEFVRYRPDGTVVSVDKAPKHRELLSPAVARNAHFTFRATVVFPRGKGPGEVWPESAPYTIHIAQNPEDTAKIALYQEQYTGVGGEWIPDRLKPVEMPHGAALEKGQAAQSYLVDLFIPATAAANQRFRVEVQFHRGDGWMIYPMELRVRQAAVDSRIEVKGVLPPIGQPLAALIEGPLRSYACGGKPVAAPAPAMDSGRALLLRNILEDLNLARQREQSDTRDGVVFMLLEAAGLSDLPAFCAAKAQPRAETEWWLKARDYLYQAIPVR